MCEALFLFVVPLNSFFSDLEAIKGKTFKAKLNSIELLSDEEVEKLFGLEPRFNKASFKN